MNTIHFLTSLISVEKTFMLVFWRCCIISVLWFSFCLWFSTVWLQWAYTRFSLHVGSLWAPFSLTCVLMYFIGLETFFKISFLIIFSTFISLSHFHMEFQINIMLVLPASIYHMHFLYFNFFFSILQSGYFL